MNKSLSHLLFVFLIFFSENVASQTVPESGDPPNKTDIPGFYQSGLSDIEHQLSGVKTGEVKTIAVSPGGIPVYAVYYGKKEDFRSQANYNAAVAARNPAYYAKKTRETKPVIFFLGPVHGQEAEGIAGLVNLIQVAETGKDHRGKEWPVLKSYLDNSRVIIVPCGNPDGRKRCPYDSFVGLPAEIMTKYGQGTHKDGALWGWPGAKSLHPMKGDVGILGAYFNDDGINIMHDDFFSPMAEETKAILKIARDEAPDMTVSLHSYELPPSILLDAYLPFFMKKRVANLAIRLNERYKQAGLPHMPEGWNPEATIDDKSFPPREPFNLIGALHHVSGAMTFTFECSHGITNKNTKKPVAGFDDILDIELNLYQEMFEYLSENRLYWE
jgi:hypothetical protein